MFVPNRLGTYGCRCVADLCASLCGETSPRNCGRHVFCLFRCPRRSRCFKYVCYAPYVPAFRQLRSLDRWENTGHPPKPCSSVGVPRNISIYLPLTRMRPLSWRTAQGNTSTCFAGSCAKRAKRTAPGACVNLRPSFARTAPINFINDPPA